MIHDVVAAEYRGDYRIEVWFDDGRHGIVDFAKYLDRNGVFQRLRNLEFFRQFSVDRELGILTWRGEVDVAPESLYSEATGVPLPEWMSPDETSLPVRTQ